MNILVPASDGCEEIETISIIDVLRRAEANVTFASIKPVTQELPILTGSNGIKLICDEYFYNILGIDYDMIVLPGGIQNAEALSNNQELIHKIKAQKLQKKWLAAICASPAIVFEKHNILDNEYATCHPGVQDLIKNKQKINDRVVISNKIITSRGPGTALEFSLALVENLFGIQKATNLAKTMLIRR